MGGGGNRCEGWTWKALRGGGRKWWIACDVEVGRDGWGGALLVVQVN